MRETISTKAILESDGSAKAIVRKIVTDSRGRFIAKYALNHDGEWVDIPEAARYPDECLFDCAVHPNLETADLAEYLTPEEYETALLQAVANWVDKYKAAILAKVAWVL